MSQPIHKLINLVTLCVLLMAASIVGHAASFTSVQSGNWDDPMTWGAPSVPGATDDVTIANGHNVTIFFFSHPVNNLTINNGGILDLNGFSILFSQNGATFTNNGKLANTSANNSGFFFGGNGAPGVTQGYSGAGLFSGNMRILLSGVVTVNVAPSSSMTFDTANNFNGVEIHDNGTTLNLTNSLDFTAPTGPSSINFINFDSTVTGAGGLKTHGNVHLISNNTTGELFDAPVELLSGAAQASGGFEGAITIDSGASLKSNNLSFSNDLTIQSSGLLDLNGQEMNFFGSGKTFKNDGTLDNSGAFNSFRFGRNGPGVVTQTLSGAGTYSGNVRLQIVDGVTLNFGASSSMTFNTATDHSNMEVISPSTLNLTNALNFSAPTGVNFVEFINAGTITGSGGLRTHGNVYLVGNAPNPSFNAPVEIVSGTAQGYGFFAGTFTIDSGATFAGFNATEMRLSGNWINNGTFLPNGNTVNYNGSTMQTVGGNVETDFSGLKSSNPLGITINLNTQVATLTLESGEILMPANTLTLTGSYTRTSGHVVGTVKKNVAAGSFVYPVGTTGAYSPVDVNVTNGSGDLSVKANTGTVPAIPALNSLTTLQRYWTLAGSGLTANLTFHYLDPNDLSGNETNYRLIRVSGGSAVSFMNDCPNPALGKACADPTVNTALVNGVSNFSDWTLGEVVAPTAANGTVSGRILDTGGHPVAGAVVKLEGTQNRKIITDANGVYRFDNVEANGFYTVTPSRVNYSFSPAVRSFSQIGETTEAPFSATPASGNFANPLDTPEYFVRQHYLDFLGREPDEAGFNFWSSQIIECGPDTSCIERRRENVSAAFFLSIEFQQTGGLVDGLYRVGYGIRPDFAALMPDTRAVGLGIVVGQPGWETKLQANKEAFANAFVNRPAFHAAYDGMDNRLFVDTLLSHTSVSFTSAEREMLVGGLANGTQTRAEVLRSVAENSRFVNAKFNETFVMMEYFGYLRRDADSNGFVFWLNKLNEFNGNFERAEMVRAFIVSGEFRERFPR